MFDDALGISRTRKRSLTLLRFCSKKASQQSCCLPWWRDDEARSTFQGCYWWFFAAYQSFYWLTPQDGPAASLDSLTTLLFPCRFSIGWHLLCDFPSGASLNQGLRLNSSWFIWRVPVRSESCVWWKVGRKIANLQSLCPRISLLWILLPWWSVRDANPSSYRDLV